MKFEDILVHHDDSSDEETVNKRVKAYNLDKSWKKFKKSDEFKNLREKRGISYVVIKLSFVAHALGIKTLYQPAVNDKYYPQKVKFLKNNNLKEKQIDELLKSTLDTVIKMWVKECCTYLRVKNKDKIEKISKEQQQEIYNNLCALLAKKNKNLRKRLLGNRALLRQKYYERLLKNIRSELADFKVTVIEEFIKEVQINVYNYRARLKDSFLKEPKYFSLFRAINHKAYLLILKLLKDAKVIDTKNSDNKDSWRIFKSDDLENASEKVAVLTKKHKYRELITVAWKILAKTSRKSVVKALNDIPIGDLGIAYVKDLRRNDQAQSTNYEGWQLSKEYPLLKIFLSVSEERLRADASESFDKLFYKYLLDKQEELKLDQINRTTLGDACVLSAKNSLGFFTGLRLANRSQKRLIKNIANNPLITALHDKEPDEDTRGKHYIKKVHCNWQFFNKKAAETQGILTSLGRDDFVDNAGSYQDVFRKISKLIKYLNEKKDLKITDALIATWIRDVHQGKKTLTDLDDKLLGENEKDTLRQLLTDFTYLLLGCEPTRNPAMFIIMQMALDLIIYKGFTWEDVLLKYGKFNDGGLMPMSPDKVVAVARHLENIYRDFMPYPYEYKGTDKLASSQQLEDLMEREAIIMHQWLCWYMEDDKAKMSFWRDKKLSEIANHICGYDNLNWFSMEDKQSEDVIVFRI
jgi:hypothetical protein